MKKTAIFLTAFAAILCIWTAVTFRYVNAKFQKVPDATISRLRSSKPLAFTGQEALHQVNTVNRLKKKNRRYTGFETDVFYLKDNFYVAHDENELSDLTLEALLAEFINPQNTYLWLDLKNAPETGNMAQRLTTLLQTYKLPVENVVIEALPQAAKQLSDAGFYTAIHACCFDKNMPQEAANALIKQIEENIRFSGASALSAGINGYTFIRQYFPEMDKIVYYTKTKIPGFKRRLMSRRVLQDATVKMLLVDEY